MTIRIRCPEKRRIIKAAVKAGWVFDGVTRGGHLSITWPPTGQRLTTGATGGRDTWKHFARDIFKVSGVDLRPNADRRNSSSTARAVPVGADGPALASGGA